MRTIPAALTWELFSRGRWQLPLMTCAGSLLPVLVYSALNAQGALSPADSAFIIIHFAMVQVIMFTFGAGLMQSLGPISRLYAYPARTSTLVAWQLLPAMALMMLEMIVTSAVLNAVYGVGWPLWGPSLFAAVAISAVLATMWLTEKSAWLPWAVGLVASVLGLWLKSRHGDLFDHPTHYWNVVTVWDGIVLALIALASYAVAVYGVSRHRRGDTLPALGVVASIDRMFNSGFSEAVDPFPSPVEAQLWFEWRKKGWGLPACVIFLYVFGGLGWLIFSRDPKLVVEGLCIAGGVMMGVIGFLGGLMLGDCGTRDFGGVMGHFLATRPLSNTRLARIMLWNSAKSIAAAWLLWIVPSALISFVLIVTGTVHLAELDPFLIESWWWYLPATLIAPWTVSTCLAALTLTGRQKLMMVLFLAGFGLFLGLNAFAESALPYDYDQRLGFWRGVNVGFSGLVAIGTALLFSLAKRRALIDTPTVWASLAVWSLLIAGLVGIHLYDPQMSLAACLFVGGMLALTVAPFAGTPLALAWNRTR